MSASPLVLKNPKGWFAAGAEVEKALTLLSDGAFKLYVYLCLNVRRDTATLETTQTELARGLKKGSAAAVNTPPGARTLAAARSAACTILNQSWKNSTSKPLNPTTAITCALDSSVWRNSGTRIPRLTPWTDRSIRFSPRRHQIVDL